MTSAGLPKLVTMDVRGYPSLGALLRDALIMHKGETLLQSYRRKRTASSWSGLDVQRYAERVTATLQDQGLEPGGRVAILAENQPLWLVTATGVFFAGGVVVPIDYKLSPEEQQALIGHSAAQFVVVDYGIWQAWTEAPAGAKVWVLGAPEDAALGDARRAEDLCDGPAQHRARAATDLATIVYSSGTGGTPKGCCLSHGAYLAQLHALLGRFPMTPGDRYFSILPTNHAIDFMVGFLGPFTCGATVVHQRTLRPEFIRWTMQESAVTHMAVVPLLLEAFKRTIDERLDDLDGWRRTAADALVDVNARLTVRAPWHAVSSRLLKPIHDAFGGKLRVLFCGGAYTDPELCRFFYRLGLPVVVGYGLTEACTVVTVNALRPYRPDSVGSVVEGVEVRLFERDDEGVGEVQVRGSTVMLGYLDAPDLNEEAFMDGWLRTGDLGRFDASGALHLVGRQRDLIVTSGGKNVYPQDVESAFSELGAEEWAVFAHNYLWPRNELTGEELVLVVRGEMDDAMHAAFSSCNRRLPDFKRVSGVLTWSDDFPRTASMKLKRMALAEQVRDACTPEQVRR